MGKSSSSNSQTANTQTDARSISTVDDRDTVTNVTGSDAAAINQQNTDFLAGVAGQQTDAVRLVAQMQANSFDNLGGVFTDISKTTSDNAAQAWTHTIDAGEALFSKVIDASNTNSDSARALAQSAVNAYMPNENKNADTFKYAAIAGAAVVALMVMKKA